MSAFHWFLHQRKSIYCNLRYQIPVRSSERLTLNVTEIKKGSLNCSRDFMSKTSVIYLSLCGFSQILLQANLLWPRLSSCFGPLLFSFVRGGEREGAFKCHSVVSWCFCSSSLHGHLHMWPCLIWAPWWELESQTCFIIKYSLNQS